MTVTREQLVQISDAWGELAFKALETLERTAPALEQAKKNGAPIPTSIRVVRASAETDLDAALYAAPALIKATGWPAS